MATAEVIWLIERLDADLAQHEIPHVFNVLLERREKRSAWGRCPLSRGSGGHRGTLYHHTAVAEEVDGRLAQVVQDTVGDVKRWSEGEHRRRRLEPWGGGRF